MADDLHTLDLDSVARTLRAERDALREARYALAQEASTPEQRQLARHLREATHALNGALGNLEQASAIRDGRRIFTGVVDIPGKANGPMEQWEDVEE